MGNLQIVLATKNEGKVREFRKLVAGAGIEIKGLYDFGPIPGIEEDCRTFEDNAYKKAHFTAKYLGIPALADDSGLVVNALGGEPGVYSARYAGENATDMDNNLKLLAAMKGKKCSCRSPIGRLWCVRSPDPPAPHSRPSMPPVHWSSPHCPATRHYRLPLHPGSVCCYCRCLLSIR